MKEEIFRIGDVVGSKHFSKATIRSFVVVDGEMIVNFEEDTISCNISWLTKLPPQSKPEQPKKERIVITQYSNINIPEEKFPAIKAALERVLNDEDGKIGVWDRHGISYVSYSQYHKELREAEEKAYNQGIDNCMEIVKQEYDYIGLNFPVRLMSKLNELKKP